ncbi:Fe(3+) dicitrate ABC transporter substrate-binding protein [Domibacillus sp. DTU_2020_1001157_1_SI_ALB_TIR_016]|uniref:ABC transporter substrate-binding protein n=1 Tax=Domibacillus sp. DTU_2020_1001157_1_SI_ALB_TIR_016 TaxID=3077789 RepID=UPI0028E8F165|nr:Fe(3+) dicitrate ABC transporter substrate-binding protein [Domibacillus sp. DTU_2020_1001157_1_SI_ALB_TIR_016]WNS79031.1 Fe(3+) dicitrate ABC transporter substrate-binding protein [Domibacillus sp. DTU_2020_1001157_1_SI_ALB_TIR_016]
MLKWMKTGSVKGAGLLLAIAVLLALAGCSSTQKAADSENAQSAGQTESGNTKTITHEMGETEIEGTPKKVVALELSFVDSLNALGIDAAGIADDEKKEMIAKLVGKETDYTSVGTREQPNLEVISSLQPDLIIADAERHKNVYEDLQKIAPTIVLKSRESTYQENLDAFNTIAQAVGKEEEAKTRLAEHEKTIEETKAKLKADPNATILPAVVRDTSFQAHTSSSYDGELLEHLGFKNAIQQEEPYAEMNLEQLVEIDPDILLLANNDGKLITDEWKNNPLWKNLKAVKNGQVYDVDRDLWTRFRGVASAEAIGADMLKMLGENK